MLRTFRIAAAELWGLRDALRSLPWFIVSAVHTETYLVKLGGSLSALGRAALDRDFHAAREVGVGTLIALFCVAEGLLGAIGRGRELRDLWKDGGR